MWIYRSLVGNKAFGGMHDRDKYPAPNKVKYQCKYTKNLVVFYNGLPGQQNPRYLCSAPTLSITTFSIKTLS
jgi:hypothetical protein